MLRVALVVHVYRITGSTLATGMMTVVSMTPALLAGPVAGVCVDRWDRRRTMIVADLLLMGAVLPLGLARDAGMMWLVYTVAFGQSVVARFFAPAEQALLPALVPSEHLAPANALSALNMNLARLIGPVLGGAIAGLSGIGAVAVIDAATFAVSALMIGRIRVPVRAVPAAPHDAIAPAALWREWRDGLVVVRRDRSLSLVMIATAITGVGEGVMSALFVVFLARALGGGAPELGLLNGGQAAGGLIGGLVIGRLARRLSPMRLVWLGAAGLGAIDLAIFNYPALAPVFWPALVLFVIVGGPAAALVTGLLTILQTGAQDDFRGRVFSVYSTIAALATLTGATLAGLLGDRVGVVRLINVQGFGYLTAGALVFMLGRRERGVDSGERAGDTETAPSPAV
jgi:predicted MFS family arabinose efflux permease